MNATTKMTDSHKVQTNQNSSKGNQVKWKTKEGYWYKADFLGYEGLSEYITSQLLQKTNLLFVNYDIQKMEYQGHTYNGCRSTHFLQETESLVTLSTLFRKYRQEDIAKECASREDIKERICYVVDTVVEITGLQQFGQYLSALLEMDAIFLNEDRHFNNIAVIYNEDQDTYTYCPIFDNGASLLSDTTIEYPLEDDVYKCIDRVQAKPFSTDFEEQLDAIEQLYGAQFKHWITSKDVENLIDQTKKIGIYSEQKLSRIETCLKEGLRKYSYLKTDVLPTQEKTMSTDKEQEEPDYGQD